MICFFEEMDEEDDVEERREKEKKIKIKNWLIC